MTVLLTVDRRSDPPGAFTEERGLGVAEFMNRAHRTNAFSFDTETFQLRFEGPEQQLGEFLDAFKEQAQAYLDGYCEGFTDGRTLRLKETRRGTLPD